MMDSLMAGVLSGVVAASSAGLAKTIPIFVPKIAWQF
jgi:hypothetical protein